jgi:hypothetical protein
MSPGLDFGTRLIANQRSHELKTMIQSASEAEATGANYAYHWKWHHYLKTG